jgi:hypothetical protein
MGSLPEVKRSGGIYERPFMVYNGRIVIGTNGLREALAGGHVKGSMVRAHLKFVHDRYGAPAIASTLAVLPPEIAAEIDGALASSWCTFAGLVSLDRAIARVRIYRQHPTIVSIWSPHAHTESRLDSRSCLYAVTARSACFRRVSGRRLREFLARWRNAHVTSDLQLDDDTRWGGSDRRSQRFTLL